MKKVAKRLLRDQLNERLNSVPEADEEGTKSIQEYWTSYNWVTSLTQISTTPKTKKYRKSYKRRKHQTLS